MLSFPVLIQKMTVIAQIKQYIIQGVMSVDNYTANSQRGVCLGTVK